MPEPLGVLLFINVISDFGRIVCRNSKNSPGFSELKFTGMPAGDTPGLFLPSHPPDYNAENVVDINHLA
jgi:hypothetical protein